VILEFPFRLLRAAATILRSPRLLLPLLVPWGVGIASYASFVWLAFSYRSTLVDHVIAHADTWYWRLLEWVVFGVNLVVCGFAAWLVTGAVSGFFVELFVERALVRSGLRPAAIVTIGDFARATWRGLAESARRLLLGVGLAILFLLTGFFPLLWILPALLSAWLLGADLFQLPYLLMNVPRPERRAELRNRRFSVLGMGAWMTFVLGFPFAGILVMPLGYLVAVEELARWRLAGPETAPPARP
jgi:uncharacterized protein involved in cysteine biosynthesis